MDGSNAKATAIASTNAVTKPASRDHFLRVKSQTARIGHNSAKMCGLIMGINSAAPARNGRSSSKVRKSTMPSNRSNPTCPATRQAGTGAKRYPANRNTSGGFGPSPYRRQMRRMLTTSEASKIASHTIHAQYALSSPGSTTTHNAHGGQRNIRGRSEEYPSLLSRISTPRTEYGF